MKKIWCLCLLLCAVLLVNACQTAPSPAEYRLTLLHTNDAHSALDYAPRLTTAINQVRDSVGRSQLLLLDAGDALTGSLYSNLFKGDAEAWFMNHDGYDTMTLGNHEFDYGSAYLADFISRLEFPVTCADMQVIDSSPLRDLYEPYLVFNKNGAQYAVFGLTSSQNPILSSPGPDISFTPEISAAAALVAQLEQKGLHRIIVLSHLGWDRDLELAAQVPGIDVIVGGHTHTVPEQYPTEVRTGDAVTLVVQAGAQIRYLGRLDLTFSEDGRVLDWADSRLIPIDEEVAADAEGTAKIAFYQESIEVYKQDIVGRTTVDLDGDRVRNRSQETNLGNLVADSMLEKAATVGVDLALLNGGGIRDSLPAGDISLGGVLSVLPFGNFLVTVDVTGAQLREALENGVSQVAEQAGRFPQIAGFRFTWDPQAEPGRRIVSVEIRTADGYQPLDPQAVYRLATTNYLAGGGDGYSILQSGSQPVVLGDVDADVLTAYLEAHSPVSPVIEGRITLAGQ